MGGRGRGGIEEILAARTRLAVYFGLAFAKGVHDNSQYSEFGDFLKEALIYRPGHPTAHPNSF